MVSILVAVALLTSSFNREGSIMEVRVTDVWKSLILDCLYEMKHLAQEGGFTAKQELNGVTVLVNPDSNINLVFRDQQRAQSGYIQGEVGPYPPLELNQEEIENDARIRAQHEREAQERQAEYDKQIQAKRDALTLRLQHAPLLHHGSSANNDAWQKYLKANTDGYGRACVDYAERWGRLMQLEMSNGHELENIAEPTSHEADIEGITGFMYGCAVAMLSQCWIHGEKLRVWHNLKTQIGEEGEEANRKGSILNPAVLKLN